MRTHQRIAALLAGCSILVGIPAGPLAAQQQRQTTAADDDLLAPLVPPKPAADDDLLAPLVPPKKAPSLNCNQVLANPPKVTVDGVELAPLVKVKPNKRGDDLLTPLVPSTQAEYEACRRKVDDDTKRKTKPLSMPTAAARLGLREVKHYDPCYSFYMSWGGNKTCYSGTWSSWEAVSEGGGPPPSDPPAPPPPEDAKPPSRPVGGLPSRSLGSPPASAPRRPPPPLASPTGPGQPPAPTGAPSGPRPGTPGGTAAPVLAGGWQRLKEFAVRLEMARIDPQGRLDVTVTIRNETRAAQLVSRGDWTALVADADGLAKQDGVIWAATEGPPRDFTLMPSVAPGATVRVRFVVAPPRVRTTLATFMLHQSGTRPAVFPLTNLDDRGDRTTAVVALADAPFTTGALFDLRVDGIRYVGGRTQLFFTARNRSAAMQHADGGALRITAAGGVATDGASYSVRGPLGEQSGMAPVEPGTEVRLRAVFPGRAAGPFTFDDGKGKVAVPVPPAGAGKPNAEPVW